MKKNILFLNNFSENRNIRGIYFYEFRTTYISKHNRHIFNIKLQKYLLRKNFSVNVHWYKTSFIVIGYSFYCNKYAVEKFY